jgi:hypothetical protein
MTEFMRREPDVPRLARLTGDHFAESDFDAGAVEVPASEVVLPKHSTTRRGEHEVVGITSSDMRNELVIHERRNGTDRVRCVFGSPNTARPLIVVIASTISSRRRMVSSRRMRNAAASPYLRPQYPRTSTRSSYFPAA